MVVEDSAALLGIVIAALGIFLTDITGNTFYDALSSIIIGCILMSFAFFLAKENRGLLLGESISTQQYEKIIQSINSHSRSTQDSNHEKQCISVLRQCL